MPGMTGIINLIEKLTVIIKQKSTILTGTTSILNPGDITVIDTLAKRSTTTIIIMKITIAAGKKTILNPGGHTVIDIFTKRSITIMKTTIAVGLHERI